MKMSFFVNHVILIAKHYKKQNKKKQKKTNLWSKLTLARIHKMQMISRKGNLAKTGPGDGLTAALLEARYERETPVNLWLISSSFILDFYDVIPSFTRLKSQRHTFLTISHITQHFIDITSFHTSSAYF